MKNKGQMFLITAAIIIVILVLLRTGINLPDILQREKELKSRLDKEFFLNIVDELVKVIDISYHQSSNVTNNVFDFGNFTRKKMTERLQSFEFLYVGSITPVSSGNDTMNVTVVNLLNKPISATLRFNNSGGTTEMLPTYAENSTQDVTAEVNASDDVFANETCSGTTICFSPWIYYNFTTLETWENITFEGYWASNQPGASAGSQYCWNGSGWIYVGDYQSTEQTQVRDISACSNADGNYTFRTYCTVLGPGDVWCKLFVDYVFLNKTAGGDVVGSSEMLDYGRWDTNFSINQSENYILTVSYNGIYEENVTIATKSNESMYVGFFDINLIGSETTYKDKFQKSYTLP